MAFAGAAAAASARRNAFGTPDHYTTDSQWYQDRKKMMRFASIPALIVAIPTICWVVTWLAGGGDKPDAFFNATADRHRHRSTRAPLSPPAPQPPTAPPTASPPLTETQTPKNSTTTNGNQTIAPPHQQENSRSDLCFIQNQPCVLSFIVFTLLLAIPFVVAGLCSCLSCRERFCPSRRNSGGDEDDEEDDSRHHHARSNVHLDSAFLGVPLFDPSSSSADDYDQDSTTIRLHDAEQQQEQHSADLDERQREQYDQEEQEAMGLRRLGYADANHSVIVPVSPQKSREVVVTGSVVGG